MCHDLAPTQRVKPKKSLGQHFLHDKAVAKRIADYLEITPHDRVLEIGPGPGALTEHLKQMPLAELILLEKDANFAKLHAANPLPNMKVLCSDALDFPWPTLAGPWKLISNLPYNIASPLLWNIISQTPDWQRGVFMVQKEVGDRIKAAPGSKTYGGLSVWLQSFASIHKVMLLRPGAFNPPPKVDSTVLLFSPLPKDSLPANPNRLAKIIKICFTRRRKQLGTILSLAFPGFAAHSMLNYLDIDATIRPEALSVTQFQQLANNLPALQTNI